MPRYTVVKEFIGEYIYSVEADDEEAAVALVLSGLIEPETLEVVSTDGPITLVDEDFT